MEFAVDRPEWLMDVDSGEYLVWVESAAGLYGALDAKFVTTSGSESRLGSASNAEGLLIQTSVGNAGGRGCPAMKRSGWAGDGAASTRDRASTRFSASP